MNTMDLIKEFLRSEEAAGSKACEDDPKAAEEGETEYLRIQALRHDGKKAVQSVADSDWRNAFPLAMVTALTGEHRTTQQDFFRTIFQVISYYGSLPNDMIDGRNEDARNKCAEIAKQFDLYLPRI